MGSVWKVRDLTTQRVVAVKLLHDASPEQARRFVREAALLAQLAHPGIVEYVAHDAKRRHPRTPSYMAPEQAQGDALPRPALDVFSLGCRGFVSLGG